MSAESANQPDSFGEELNERATRCTRVMEEILHQVQANLPVELRKHMLDQAVNEPIWTPGRDNATGSLPQNRPRAAAS